jgi:hypothetical protein
VRAASLCGLGQTAANPVLSTLRHFRDEYLVHIKEKHCPAGVCHNLSTDSTPADGRCPRQIEGLLYLLTYGVSNPYYST